MYSKSEKTEAVKLFIHSSMNASDPIRARGDYDFKSLHKWYEQGMEEQKTGRPWEFKMKQYSQV